MSVARILEEDPELNERVPDTERARAAAEALAQVQSLSNGTWREPAPTDIERDGFGLLVLDGILTRKVTLGRFESTEVLGQGDLLRPWAYSSLASSSIESEVTWKVVEPARLAALDRRFAAKVAQWPEISAMLMDRVMQRSRWLAFQLAVCHVVRVDTRLLLMLWHFADRWGRMTPEGARVRLPITHSAFASVVGARRPSVTTALGRLQEEGLIQRMTDGSWLLRGSPPAEYARVNGAAAAQG